MLIRILAVLVACVCMLAGSRAAFEQGGIYVCRGTNCPPVLNGISLSPTSFTGGSASGTVVGTLAVAVTPGSFTGSYQALQGPDAALFQIVGGQLQTAAVNPARSYNVTVCAQQANAVNGSICTAFLLSGTSQNIATVALSCGSSCAFTAGTAGTIGTASATLSPTTPAFSGTWSLQFTGSDHSGTTCDTHSTYFSIAGNTVSATTSAAVGSYNLCVVATQSGLANSPFVQAVAITGNSGVVATFPLTVSGGALLTASGQPYMIAGDNPQGGIGIQPCSATPPSQSNCQTSADVLPTNPTWVALMKDRAANGINSVVLNVLCEGNGGYHGCGANSSTVDGLLPFSAQLSGSPTPSYVTINGTTRTCPESTPPADEECWDVSTAGASTPTSSAAFWTRIDELIFLAGQQGIQVLLDIYPTDSEGGATKCPSNSTSFQAMFMNNRIATGNMTKVQAFADFLANRYAQTANLVWWFGNDNPCWNQSYSSIRYDDVMFAMATELHAKEVSNHTANSANIVHVITTEVDGGLTSLDDTTNTWSSAINLNGIYQTFNPTGLVAYDPTLHAYGQSTAIVPFIVETAFQGDGNFGSVSSVVANCTATNINNNPNACAIRERHQFWWSFLSGAVSGYAGGNVMTTSFPTGWNTNGGGTCLGTGNAVGTSACVDTFATTQTGYMAKFAMKYPSFPKLVPDVTQGGAAIASPFITGGANRGTYGAANVSWVENNWVSSGAASDGTVAIAYMPGTSSAGAVQGSQAIQVNNAKVGGTGATYYWYDPTKDPTLSSSYVNTAGTANTALCSPSTTACLAGNQTFTTPSANHSDGYADWVLVGTSAAAPPSITGIALSGSSFTCGTAGTVGAVTVAGTGSISGATLSLTGTDAAQFSLSSTTVPSNLTVGSAPTGCPRTYNLNIVATLPGATGSPFTQAETITGRASGVQFVNAVTGTAGTGTAVTTATATLTGAVAGNGLIATVSGCYTNSACTVVGNPTTSPVTSTTGTQGDTCTAVPSTYNGAQPAFLQIWLCIPTTSGSDTITFNFSGGVTYGLVQISQFSGLASPPNDSAANTTTTGTGATASITTAGAGTTVAGDLVYSTISNSNGAWVAGQTAATGAGTNQLSEYQIAGAAGVYSNTASGGVSGTWYATLAAFKAAPPTITGITLSNSSFTCGTAGTVGAITVQGTNNSGATLSLTGTDAAQFSLSSTTVPANLTVAASPTGCPRSYSLNIVATLSGATGSPFTQAETITGAVPLQFVNAVTGTAGTGTPVTSIAATLTGAVAGNGLIATVSGCYTNSACTVVGSPTTSPVSSTTGSQGDTCSAVPSTYNGAQPAFLQIWLCIPATSGSDTVTFNFSGGVTYGLVQISQFAGLASPPNDSAANTTTTGTGASASITTAGAGTTVAGDLIYSTISNSAGAWAAGQTAATGAGTNQLSEYQVAGPAGVYSNTATGGVSGTWYATLAAFKATITPPQITGISIGSPCCTFTGNQSAGTTIGSLSATLSGSQTFTGSFATSTTATNCNSTNGANNNLFTVAAGSNPAVTVASGQTLSVGNTYALCVAATQSGASNSPLGYAITITVNATSTAAEEFIGPLLGWKRIGPASASPDFVCDNTGGSDVASCLQSAINTLPTAGGATNPVLYLLPGTYRINSTIGFPGSGTTGNLGIMFIGADPATTTIQWGGSAGGTMITVGTTCGGTAAAKFARVTLNGTLSGNAATRIVDEHMGCPPGGSTSYFDTTLEYSDMVFENAVNGFSCGFAPSSGTANGCASISLIRDVFKNLTGYGVSVGNFNALDVDAFYSQFINNNVSITTANGPSGAVGRGSINAYGSYFQGNTVDVQQFSPVLQALQGNFSTGSGQFVSNGGTLTNTAFASFFANTVVGPTSSPTVDFNMPGWPSIGNQLVGTGTPVERVNAGNSDLLSAGNVYSTGTVSATCAGSAPVTASRCHEITSGTYPDTIGSISTTAPTMPGTPPNNGPGGNNIRQIYEVGTCASFEGSNCHSNASISAAVTAALASGTAKPVVHIPAGSYSGVSVTIPACQTPLTTNGCDIQIIGDGYQTVVAGSGTATFTLTGPSNAVVRDMMINSATTVDGVLITNADQAGARVFSQQTWVNANPCCVITGVFLDTLSSATVEMHDFMPGGTNNGGTGAKITGGTFNVFGGSGTSNWNQLAVSGSPNVFWMGVWNDNDGGGSGSHECQVMTATGSGNIVYAASQSADGQDTAGGCASTTAYMQFNNFTGNAFISGVSMDVCQLTASCTIGISGTATNSNILIDGMLGPPNSSTNWVNDTSTGSHTVNFLNNIECNITGGGGVGSCISFPQAPEFCTPSSPCPNVATMNGTLGQAVNTRMVYPTALAAGVTNVQLYRIFVEGANNGVHVQH